MPWVQSAPNMASPHLSSPFRRHTDGHSIKKVSSTGGIDDERAAAIGLERQRHERRYKGRMESRMDLSEEEDEIETRRRCYASGSDTVASRASSSVESTERTCSNKAVLLTNHGKNTLLSMTKKKTIIAEDVLTPSLQQHLTQESSGRVPHLHVMAATAASEQLAQSPRLHSAGFDQSSKRVLHHITPLPTTQSDQMEPRKIDRSSQRRPGESSKSSLTKSLINDQLLTPVRKTQLKRIQSTPVIKNASKPSLVDVALMDRAISIRESLRQYELQELAAEAERAADSGHERFVGSASKFVMEDKITQTPLQGDVCVDDFVYTAHQSESPTTRITSLANCHAMDCTPLYFGQKKIRVTSLRGFAEVVPNFSEMHDNIRVHLGHSGVDARFLKHHQIPLTNPEGDVHDDDLISQAGSIESFSSSVIASFKSIVEYVDGSRSKSMSHNPDVPSGIQPTLSPLHNERKRSRASKISSSNVGSCFGSGELKHGHDGAQERILDRQCNISGASVPLGKTSTLTSDSDDSSVELYGRRSKGGRNSRLTVSNVEECDEILQSRSLFTNDTFDSNDTSKSVAKFFSRIQNKLSGNSVDPKPLSKNEANRDFISNHFYTNCDANSIPTEGLPNFRLDINPDAKRSDRCTSGCDSVGNNMAAVFRKRNDGLCTNSCETVGVVADAVFSWLNASGVCDTSAKSKSLDLESRQSFLQNSWIRNWQTEDYNRRRFFLPPRLDVTDRRYSRDRDALGT